MKLVFITGALRSGTTLMDRLLGQLEGIDSSYSQPLPLLFTAIKQRFLQQLSSSNSPVNYPLTDQQFDNYYPAEKLVRFIEAFDLTPEFVQTALNKMINYSGQGFKPYNPLKSLNSWSGGSLDTFLRDYFKTHQQNAGDIKTVCFKEVFCEEFIPYFAHNADKIILVIRDPRDVLTSMYYGNYNEFVGKARPFLFSIRQWRKSAAYALQFQHHPDVNIIRYEDLVIHTNNTIKLVSDFLGLAPIDKKREFELRNHDGSKWQANSSFNHSSGISTQSVGRYASLLPAPVTDFVEATCWAEMQALGYQTALPASNVETMLKQISLDEPDTRPELADYLFNHQRRLEETIRWQRLRSSNPKYNAKDFIFTQAYKSARASAGRIE